MGAAPMTFMCPEGRKDKNENEWRRKTGNAPITRRHTITRTGRIKPNSSNRRGSRILSTSWEFSCSCGRKGWSKHSGVLVFPVADTIWYGIESLPYDAGKVIVRNPDPVGFVTGGQIEAERNLVLGHYDRDIRDQLQKNYTEWSPR